MGNCRLQRCWHKCWAALWFIKADLLIQLPVRRQVQSRKGKTIFMLYTTQTFSSQGHQCQLPVFVLCVWAECGLLNATSVFEERPSKSVCFYPHLYDLTFKTTKTHKSHWLLVKRSGSEESFLFVFECVLSEQVENFLSLVIQSNLFLACWTPLLYSGLTSVGICATDTSKQCTVHLDETEDELCANCD